MSDTRIIHGRYASYTCDIADDKSEKHRGGNGQVFLAQSVNSSDKAQYVVKFFWSTRQKRWNREKRYNRFKNEIEKVSMLQNHIDGIIPIIDFSFPENCPDDDFSAWYVMPKAELFSVSDKASLKDKLSNMVDLAHIIKSLHDECYAHRDIKPDNIFFYKGKIHLGDFGLVWCLEDECRYTSLDENLGPAIIMPPEMRAGDPDKLNTDQRCADVYLFAKVLWMYLSKSNTGFSGEYSRSSRQIYLSGLAQDQISIEPLHELLEKATKDSCSGRIDISECIHLLEEQLKLLDDNVSSELRDHYRFMEVTRRLRKTIVPDGMFYRDIDIVADMLNSISSCCSFVLDGNKSSFLVNSVRKKGERNLFLQYSLYQKTLFSCEGEMQEMQVLSDDTYSLLLSPIPKPGDKYEPFGKKVDDMYGLSGAFYISEPVKIVIKDKSIQEY